MMLFVSSVHAYTAHITFIS